VNGRLVLLDLWKTPRRLQKAVVGIVMVDLVDYPYGIMYKLDSSLVLHET